MDVPRSDGTNGDGEDGRDGDGVVVEKCKEDVWQKSGTMGDVVKKMVSKAKQISSSFGSSKDIFENYWRTF